MPFTKTVLTFPIYSTSHSFGEEYREFFRPGDKGYRRAHTLHQLHWLFMTNSKKPPQQPHPPEPPTRVRGRAAYFFPFPFRSHLFSIVLRRKSFLGHGV